MASIQKRGDVYKITAITGARNTNGYPIRKSTTFHPDVQKSEAEQLEDARKAAKEFEEQLNSAKADVNSKFADYSQCVVDKKYRTGKITMKTYARYCDILRRINIELGHSRMKDIDKDQVYDLYNNLASDFNGYDESCCHATEEFQASIKGMAVNHLARTSGTNEKTINRAKNGERIWRTSAEKLARALDRDFDDLFEIAKKGKKHLSPKTISEHHKLIKAIFDSAISDNICEKNPEPEAWEEYTNSKYEYSARAEEDTIYDTEPLTWDDLAAIANAAKNEPVKWQLFIKLLSEIGERRGALLGIKLNRIDIAGERIQIKNTVLSVSGKIHEKDTTKNKKSMRWVTISQEAIQLIQLRIVEIEQLRIANGDRWHEKGYLFTQENGEPMHPDSVNDYLAKFSKKYGFRHLHPHLFRHSVASLLIAEGIPPTTVADIIGDTVETIERYYAHGYYTEQAKANKLISSKISRR